MPRVFLVFGDHLSGKSTLATQLKDLQFDVVSVDDVYVKWVKSQCPSLYFEALSQFIDHHYNHILIDDYTMTVFDGRNLVAEWHAHLLALIIERSQQHDRLVVEGYLLFDCKDHYTIELTRRSVRVVQVHVQNGLYFSPLTVDEIASL